MPNYFSGMIPFSASSDMAHLPKCEIPKYESLLEMSERYPSMDPQSMIAFLRVLVASDELFRGASTVFIQHQISKGKFMLLMQLFDKENGSTRKLSPAELADALEVTRATVTGLLDGLERDGLVTRERGEKDKRMILVSLTADALALMEDVLPKHFANIAELMKGLSKAELNELTNLLGKLSDHVKKTNPDLPGLKCEL